MPSETKNRKEIFIDAEGILQNKLIFQVQPHISFLRIPKKRKKNADSRKVALQKSLEKVKERIKFYQLFNNLKFERLINFT